MATATTNHGSNGPLGPGPQDGGRRPQSGAGARRPAPSRVQAVFHPRPGRIGSLQVIRVVFAEAAAALVAVPILTKHTFWLALTGPVAILCVVAAVAGNHGRWFGQISAVRGEYRERRGQRVDAPGAEAALAPLRETFPGLRTTSVSSRRGDPVGMIGDGTFLTAVLRVGTRTEPLRAPRTAQPLPLGVVAGVLSDERLSASCVQIVTHTQPAPAPHLPAHAMAVRSYQEIMGDVPGQRTTWVAVRLDPQDAAGAIEARGGGAAGLQRTLLTAVQRVASDLEGAGFEAAALSEPELITALGTACAVNPQVGTTPRSAGTAHRTAESKRAWRCDDRWHTTYWLDKLPRLSADSTPNLVAALTSVPTLATSFAVTATRGTGGSVGFSAHVRLAAHSEGQLAEAAKALEQRAAKAGAHLTRLDGEQLPGLVATIPLGGEA
ncbi:type VII secretion protein EccE [Actinocrinis puniceicyclus]|uniref:Type VII secretion protein EccE n=1 Tax=Actinocrinis puniceicyclus TaxID=977794 RepID=A0A8J7WPX2_9ACTN|nr:type VII secretion protein EccE [Actinocrinis puniceicyclus]MBS2965328.1 type VII secretion protein EccE [Actinocrinis puniceicyclus]